jgi:hypothetical protein
MSTCFLCPNLAAHFVLFALLQVGLLGGICRIGPRCNPQPFPEQIFLVAPSAKRTLRRRTTFCGALRSRSSKGRGLASPSSGGSTMSTSSWAAPRRSSSSFCRRSSFSPSVLTCWRQSMNYCSVSLITFCSLLTSSVRWYSKFFTLVSSSSLHIKILLSSLVKSFFRT